ncbi:SRPBCC family protein [soil metagenome]
MSAVEESIEVKVPVRTAYNQWTQFESFPLFMEGVEQVEQLSNDTLKWVAEIGGKKREWTAEITEQHPDHRVAWTSREGARNAGAVTFHKLGENESKVMLQLEYEPDGAVETAGDAVGLVKSRVKGDLERFKEFIESQGGRTTGAWRGEIDN